MPFSVASEKSELCWRANPGSSGPVFSRSDTSQSAGASARPPAAQQGVPGGVSGRGCAFPAERAAAPFYCGENWRRQPAPQPALFTAGLFRSSCKHVDECECQSQVSRHCRHWCSRNTRMRREYFSVAIKIVSVAKHTKIRTWLQLPNIRTRQTPIFTLKISSYSNNVGSELSQYFRIQFIRPS